MLFLMFVKVVIYDYMLFLQWIVTVEFCGSLGVYLNGFVWERREGDIIKNEQ